MNLQLPASGQHLWAPARVPAASPLCPAHGVGRVCGTGISHVQPPACGCQLTAVRVIPRTCGHGFFFVRETPLKQKQSGPRKGG